MQPDTPYRLTAALGSAEIGTVWSAVDAEGGAVTVAVLDASIALDQRWRAAFAAVANELSQPRPGNPRILHTDFVAPVPWVACATDDERGETPGAEQIFVALGVTYQPMPARAAPSDEDTLPVPSVGTTLSAQVSGPAPPLGIPSEGEQIQHAEDVEVESATPISPWTIPPQSISASPQPELGFVESVAAPAGSASTTPDAVSNPSRQLSVPPHYPPRSALPASPPPRPRRTGLWVGVGALVLVLMAGGGTAFALRGTDGEEPQSPPSTASPASAAPMFPGIEPPQAGVWPSDWPRFAASDPTRVVADLAGLGFPIRVPDAWECTPGGRADGYARYFCGVPAGEDPRIGGELIARNCPGPCGQGTQAAMRESEEAWGLQWIRAGESTTYAEHGGAARYALVVVAFWGSEPGGDLDRQLVLRMTAPLDSAGQLQQVANDLHDALGL